MGECSNVARCGGGTGFGRCGIGPHPGGEGLVFVVEGLVASVVGLGCTLPRSGYNYTCDVSRVVGEWVMVWLVWVCGGLCVGGGCVVVGWCVVGSVCVVGREW